MKFTVDWMHLKRELRYWIYTNYTDCRTKRKGDIMKERLRDMEKRIRMSQIWLWSPSSLPLWTNPPFSILSLSFTLCPQYKNFLKTFWKLLSCCLIILKYLNASSPLQTVSDTFLHKHKQYSNSENKAPIKYSYTIHLMKILLMTSTMSLFLSGPGSLSGMHI